jgi:putative endonuclease
MPKDNAVFGQENEVLARKHLLDKGYAIVTTNWRCTAGEIDIIARDGDELVFVEVRSRHASTTEWAWRSLNEHKQARMIACAEAYMDALASESTWRIDAIAIARTGSYYQIEHRLHVID